MARSGSGLSVSVDKHLRRRQNIDTAGTPNRIVISAVHAVMYLFINLISLLEVFELVVASTEEIPMWHPWATRA